MTADALEALVRRKDPALSDAIVERVKTYYRCLLKENEAQNLTRLSGPEDFFKGHWLDAVELVKSGLVDYPALDLGSGPGVPGLLAAILEEKTWALCESEGRKADFLRATVAELGLERVSVTSERAETFLTTHSAASIVVRAVGPVERIYGWIGKCSTWNNLVLLKGPKWTEEWAEFSRGRHKNRLRVEKEYRYAIDDGPATRVIIKLARK